ncbi:adenylate/guanylate cyclase domain-containing protein [Actinoplanes sp. TFC3]|uniref:ATP-binding protein n=1 Tax=Actinoplanes sp. TFC3 TaxID=1710355 RepID=UPI00082CF342|nr:adenylate/guanylate cyclase domain-containing protein [Actinoplanes sp. TFC3]
MSGRTELPSGLVTFVFTDIEGSTRLARMLGDAYVGVLNAHRDVIRAALRNHSGVELFTEGDSFFVAFAAAADAVAACVASQRALAAYPWPSPEAAPLVRMGLHTGHAVPRDGEYTSTEVHRAARVASAAHGGQILCSNATASHLTTHPKEDLGRYVLRGFDDTERLFQILSPGLQRDFPRPRTPGAPVHNLPADLTPFAGRQSEVSELRTLLTTHRIVTVAGCGGSGKTRVAHMAARQALTSYAQGIWVVDLALTGVEQGLAAALGVRAEPGRPLLDSIIERCGHGGMLVVLDTCDARPAETRTLVRRLLAACPRLDVLATSRAPLGVPGELVWRIPPMVPADAYALLASRVQAARGGRPGPGDDGGDLARVAAKLDGHPLAIELAADRLRWLSAPQLAARLQDPIAALDAGRSDADDDALSRHDSLTRNLDWSYRALSEPAAALLRRLAVFANPVELPTVEWSGVDAFGALNELADRSFIDVVNGPRYRLSEQVKSFAARRLRDAGEEGAARERHVSWALHILDSVAVDPQGQPRTVSLTELSPYVKEWEAALRWTVTSGSVRAGLRLAGALDPWWREHGGARAGRELLNRLYRKAPEPSGELASAYLIHAGLATDRDERTLFLQRAENLAKQTNNPALQVRAKAGYHASLIEAGLAEHPERQCRAVMLQAERAGVPGAALPVVVALAELLWRRDALDDAAEMLGGARLIEAGRPEDRGRRTVDWLLGMVALRRGDLVAAHDHLVVALRSRLRHGFRGAAADAVAAIAVRCALGGDLQTAAVLFGGAESVRGARRATQFGGFWAGQQAALRRMLGDVAFDAAYAEGAGGGFMKAVAMALAVEHPDLEHPAARFAQAVG